ncbi:LPS biosynthesis glycosyltransferase [Pedobacter sp. HMF7647]|uniref:LPS biosynthesis glycosyltransferase n=1 Tax=Hufsiella arboris TaxID=2695275 RepID=A0A7K1YCT4_9SPHI|nr:glycosyltransferase family 9 protein [Hufsiella arboris]MXV52396.1 LPS biosynthesis glycosyltransferase [Hufsiella arboris]
MKLPSGSIKKIIVFRALQLGDLLCSIPALRALRNSYPDAEITITGLRWMESLLNRFPDYFDRFIHFPGYPGLPEQPLDPIQFTGFLAEVQAQRFDLALQMQGNGSLVNPMIELFNARYTAGFSTQNDYWPDKELFIEYPGYGSEIERHLLLMEHLGIQLLGTELEFPLTAQDESDYKTLDFSLEPQKYVCVHPGSRGAWRQWPVEFFASLADQCAAKGYVPVITGTKDEMHIVLKVAELMTYDPVIAAGKTSLGAVGVLIKNAALLISNCTGVSHMAAAFSTPSIVISMDGEPERWAPLNREVHKVFDWTRNQDFGIISNTLENFLQSQAVVS